MKCAPLSTFCSPVRELVQPGERPDLRYLGMESIESGTGALVGGLLSKTPETPRGVSFRFSPGTVLYGKLRPYLNKVYVADFEGKCSTELIPLQPRTNANARYLAYFLRAPSTVEQITSRTSGARMPRADVGALLGLMFPVRREDEQQLVVDRLSRAEGILRLRREAQRKAAELIPALFLDRFGDPACNPKGWPMRPLGNLLAACDYGTSRKASIDGAGIPVLRMGNVDYAGDLDLTDLKHVELDPSELDRQALRPGDLLFNRTNSKELVGKTGLWDGRWPAVAASYFIRLRVRSDLALPEYVWAAMNSKHMKRVLFATARGAIGQANINTQEINALELMVPPLDLQRRYVEELAAVRSIQAAQNQGLRAAQATFDALLHRAFAS